ncbi:MAG: Asp-tRNA(Asn)/Glu-tRNA(Gln) amidotransferase GatCAB subunit B, partial [Catalinimonas sp.]
RGLRQERSADALGPIVEAVLARHPDKVRAYRRGKKGLLGLFVGEVMRATKGQADPRLTNEMLTEALK